MVFLAILHALRPDLVDLSKARTRSNKQNLEEAFHIAEKELNIPRLLDPDGEELSESFSSSQKLVLFYLTALKKFEELQKLVFKNRTKQQSSACNT